MPIRRATNNQHIELPHVNTECQAQTLLPTVNLLPVHVVDVRRTVGVFLFMGMTSYKYGCETSTVFAFAAY